MKNLFKNFFASLPLGARLLVLVYLLAFPIALAGNYTHTFDLYGWLGLCPALVWKGQVWRVLTYGFLPAGPIDWLLGSFWLATLVSILGRNWTSLGLWGYCLLGVFGGAVPIVVFRPGMQGMVAGNFAMVFALLVAWDWFYRNERLILLGIGEVSVRQAAILIAIINSVVVFFSCGGWFLMLAMWCGGVAGWLYLLMRYKLLMGKTGQQVRSERVARLEL
jgi:membrane associated rhomboid family serine protease